jgi:sec-independent protein translocase protein TatA
MGFSIWQLLVVLAIVILLFGTKRLKDIGSDLGGALRGFKKAVKDEENQTAETTKEVEEKKGNVIEGEVIKENSKQENK